MKEKKKTKKQIQAEEKEDKINLAGDTLLQFFNETKSSVNEHGKNISISDLPKCQHRTNLLARVSNEDATICIVAVMYPKRGLWCAYAGYPDVKELKIEENNSSQYSMMIWNCEAIRTHEQVKMLGEILPKEVAYILFPEWNVKRYTTNP